MYSRLWPLSVSPRCHCVYTMAGQTLALQQNLQSSEKSQHFKGKHYLINSLCNKYVDFIKKKSLAYLNKTSRSLRYKQFPFPPSLPFFVVSSICVILLLGISLLYLDYTIEPAMYAQIAAKKSLFFSTINSAKDSSSQLKFFRNCFENNALIIGLRELRRYSFKSVSLQPYCKTSSMKSAGFLLSILNFIGSVNYHSYPSVGRSVIIS